ncbi:MAG: hypothetical protein NZ781_05220 [Armatimonadetes bacterium]|nr:hypothetical protein [Armatimonadota bacterium]
MERRQNELGAGIKMTSYTTLSTGFTMLRFVANYELDRFLTPLRQCFVANYELDRFLTPLC